MYILESASDKAITIYTFCDGACKLLLDCINIILIICTLKKLKKINLWSHHDFIAILLHKLAVFNYI